MLKSTIGAVALTALLGTAAFAQTPAPESSGSMPAAGAPAGGAAATQSSSDPTGTEVLATVDGTDITVGDVAFAQEALGEAVQSVPEAQRAESILSLLIDMHLMAEAAEEQGLGDTALLKKRLEFQRLQALQESYMQALVEDTVTDEVVAKRYEEEVAKLSPRDQVSASHILVEDEEKAKELIAELNGGADFAELAKANSKDPGTAQTGGSLGFFAEGQMVPSFEKAAFSLEPGAMTEEPVQSQFGWHIIRVDEKRTMPVPTLEQVEPQIQQVLVREAYVNAIDKLKADAAIERADDTGGADASEAPKAQ